MFLILLFHVNRFSNVYLTFYLNEKCWQQGIKITNYFGRGAENVVKVEVTRGQTESLTGFAHYKDKQPAIAATYMYI